MSEILPSLIRLLSHLNHVLQFSLKCSPTRWIQCTGTKKKLASEVLRKEGKEIELDKLWRQTFTTSIILSQERCVQKKVEFVDSIVSTSRQNMFSKTSVPVILLRGCSCVESTVVCGLKTLGVNL